MSRPIIFFLLLYAVTAAVSIPTSACGNSGKYSKLSNRELKSQGLTLVKSIRQLVYAYNGKDREITADFDAEFLATRTTERQALRDQWRKKIDQEQNASVGAYQRNFASDATLVREELQRRLPKNPAQPDVSKMYSNPANVLAIEMIADNLELLSKSLPDS